MLAFQKSPFGFLFRNEVILIFFMLVKIINAVMNGINVNSNEAWAIGILAILTYSVLAWFAYKRQAISIWAISIIMLYDAVGSTSAALNNFATTPTTSVMALIMSGYIILGALVIFSSRHEHG